MWSYFESSDANNNSRLNVTIKYMRTKYCTANCFIVIIVTMSFMYNYIAILQASLFGASNSNSFVFNVKLSVVDTNEYIS